MSQFQFGYISLDVVLQFPWIQVSRSRSLLLLVQPAMFLVAIGMGTYAFHSCHIFLLLPFYDAKYPAIYHFAIISEFPD